MLKHSSLDLALFETLINRLLLSGLQGKRDLGPSGSGVDNLWDCSSDGLTLTVKRIYTWIDTCLINC